MKLLLESQDRGSGTRYGTNSHQLVLFYRHNSCFIHLAVGFRFGIRKILKEFCPDREKCPKRLASCDHISHFGGGRLLRFDLPPA